MDDVQGARLAALVRNAAIAEAKRLAHSGELPEEEIFTVVATAGGVMVIDACRAAGCNDQEVIDTFVEHVKNRKRPS